MRVTAIYDEGLEKFADGVLRASSAIDDYQLISSTDLREPSAACEDTVLLFIGKVPDRYAHRNIRERIDRRSLRASTLVIAVLVGEGGYLPSFETAACRCISCADTSSSQIANIAAIIDGIFRETVDSRGCAMAKRSVKRHSYISLSGGFVWRIILMALSMFLIAVLLFTKKPVLELIEKLVGTGLAKAVFATIVLACVAVYSVFYVRLLIPIIRELGSAIRFNDREEELEDAARYARRLRSVVEYDDDSDDASELGWPRINALERMLVNLEDIKAYYTWSQEQARSAFRLARWLCVAGFVFLVVAVVLPLTLGMGWQASIVPAVGGATSELLAGTALLVYRHSLTQLNHYHDALHEDERFLSAVSLVDRFSEQETRDRILAEIVRSELRMNLGTAGVQPSDEKPLYYETAKER